MKKYLSNENKTWKQRNRLQINVYSYALKVGIKWNARIYEYKFLCGGVYSCASLRWGTCCFKCNPISILFCRVKSLNQLKVLLKISFKINTNIFANAVNLTGYTFVVQNNSRGMRIKQNETTLYYKDLKHKKNTLIL